MLKISELMEVVERYDRFLTWFAVGVLRRLGDARPDVESKLTGVIKGTVLPVPFEMLSKHLEHANDLEMARVKASDALWERQRLLSEIVEFLGREVGKEFAHKPLFEMMQRGDDAEKAFATTALAIFGHAQAREQLQKRFSNFSRILRWGILALLGNLEDVHWTPLFLTALEDGEPDVARMAIQALGKSGVRSAVGELYKLLHSDSEQLTIAAIQALATLHDQAAAEHLLELATQTTSDRVCATIVSALGEFPGAASQKYLTEALYCRDPRTRANAVVALKKHFLAGNSRDESIINRIAQMAQDPEHRVRADAIQALWELGRVESLNEIEKLLTSSNDKERASGAYLCGKLKLVQFKDYLRSLTDDRTWSVRKTAAIALIGFGENGKNILQQLIKDGTPDQQVCAGYALGLADDPQGVDSLLNASNSDSELGERATDLLMRLSKPADM